MRSREYDQSDSLEQRVAPLLPSLMNTASLLWDAYRSYCSPREVSAHGRAGPRCSAEPGVPQIGVGGSMLYLGVTPTASLPNRSARVPAPGIGANLDFPPLSGQRVKQPPSE